MYQLLIEKQVQKRLEKIPEPDYTRIKNAILALKTNPRPVESKKLKGRIGYRIRQGNYRIIYDIKDSILTIFILDAGHRKDIYEKDKRSIFEKEGLSRRISPAGLTESPAPNVFLFLNDYTFEKV